MITKLKFSGHETFHCRHFWLKKGYDLFKNHSGFSDLDAVTEMGVGKNMVASIKNWMKAFALIDADNNLTKIAHYIFDDNGKDPYLENIATLWLLHYLLVKTNYASIYALVFNEFRKEKIEFNKVHLASFLERKCQEQETKISENSLRKDVGVFLKNYIRPQKVSRNIEDDLSAILMDLDLIQRMALSESGGTEWYRIENLDRIELPVEIVLFAILDQNKENRILSFQSLLIEKNSVGSVFALNANGLMTKIEALVRQYPGIVFSDDAGVRGIQLKQNFNKWAILDNYYG